jgi:hypothetical protein
VLVMGYFPITDTIRDMTGLWVIRA